MDPKQLKALQWKVFENVAAASLVPLMRIGDELKLFSTLTACGPADSATFAQAAGIHARYALEWLSALAAAGYISYDAEKNQFYMTEEQTLMIGAYDSLAAGVLDEPKIRAAFKTGEGVAWGEHHNCYFRGTARFFKPTYKGNLIQRWLPKIPQLVSVLESGGSFADVGCGHGISTMLIAENYPKAQVFGFDFHGPSIEEAQNLAQQAGLGNRITYSTKNAKEYQGPFDSIAFFDCLHDMGDPVGAAAHAYTQLKDDGILVLIEPFASENLKDNLTVVGQMFYCASTTGCVPASLAQEVGFKSVEIVTTTATNMVLCAKK